MRGAHQEVKCNFRWFSAQSPLNELWELHKFQQLELTMKKIFNFIIFSILLFFFFVSHVMIIFLDNFHTKLFFLSMKLIFLNFSLISIFFLIFYFFMNFLVFTRDYKNFKFFSIKSTRVKIQPFFTDSMLNIKWNVWFSFLSYTLKLLESCLLLLFHTTNNEEKFFLRHARVSLRFKSQ